MSIFLTAFGTLFVQGQIKITGGKVYTKQEMRNALFNTIMIFCLSVVLFVILMNYNK